MITPAYLEAKLIYTGLLLGFALSIALSMIVSRDERKIFVATTIAFILASFLLLLDVYGTMRMLVQFAQVPDPVPAEEMAKIQAASQVINNFDGLGIMTVMIALGLSGWIHSRLIGILTSAGAVIAIIFVFRIVATLIA